MKFFLDENFPKSCGELLTNRGHEVFDIRGSGDEGADDQNVFRLAQDRGAILLTTDRDFFHTVPFVGGAHFGIVVVALRQPNRRSVLDRIEWFLNRFDGCDLRNKVFELRNQTYVVMPDSVESRARELREM